jgi:hypothetical protein
MPYKPNKEELEMLMALVMKMGWDLAIEDVDDEDPVQGMIIGTEEFMDEIIGDENPNFTYYRCHEHAKNPTQQ